VQLTLGALTVLSGLYVWINSLHVVCGALVLTTSLVLTLRTWRTKFDAQTVLLKPNAGTEAVRSVRLQPDGTTGARA
jgi:protein-S-isoprenylcysteine O-methyltransferase Ste14